MTAAGDDRDKEGWAVPLRAPLVALVLTPALIGLALAIGGHVYLRTIAPRTHAPLTALPQPALETIVHAPGERRRPNAEPPPPAVARAMRDAAARGDAWWRVGAP